MNAIPDGGLTESRERCEMADPVAHAEEEETEDAVCCELEMKYIPASRNPIARGVTRLEVYKDEPDCTAPCSEPRLDCDEMRGAVSVLALLSASWLVELVVGSPEKEEWVELMVSSMHAFSGEPAEPFFPLLRQGILIPP
jgi:hypothetical protein